VLGKKTYRVDRRRLAAWLAAGGLREQTTNENESANVLPMRKAG
jgi:hypothetical protein